MDLLKLFSDYKNLESEVSEILKMMQKNREESLKLEEKLNSVLENISERKEAVLAAQRESSTAPSSPLMPSASMSPAQLEQIQEEHLDLEFNPSSPEGTLEMLDFDYQEPMLANENSTEDSVSNESDAKVIGIVMESIVTTVAAEVNEIEEPFDQALKSSAEKEKMAKLKEAAKLRMTEITPKTENFAKEFEEHVAGFSNENVKVIVKETGNDFDFPAWSNEKKPNPVLVKNKAGLGLQHPNMTFELLRSHSTISAHKVTVIDSAAQEAFKKQKTIGEVVTDMNNGKGSGLNILSFTMEDLGSDFAGKFCPPSIVVQRSWVNRASRNMKKKVKIIKKQIQQTSDKSEKRRLTAEVNRLENIIKQLPKLENFLLISAEGAFTSVHVDMAATSVFYHVITGKKIFFIAPPDEENLKKYMQEECNRDSTTWLGSTMFDKFAVLEILPGQTAFIPAGWVHFVFTPENSIVYGGNFLCDQGTELQFRFAELERNLIWRKIMEAPTAFPNFDLTIFAYAEFALIEELDNGNTSLEIGCQILSALRRMNRRPVKTQSEKSEKRKRTTVIETLETKLSSMANAQGQDPIQFRASCEVKKYEFPLPKRGKSRQNTAEDLESNEQLPFSSSSSPQEPLADLSLRKRKADTELPTTPAKKVKISTGEEELNGPSTSSSFSASQEPLAGASQQGLRKRKADDELPSPAAKKDKPEEVGNSSRVRRERKQVIRYTSIPFPQRQRSYRR